MSRVVVVRFGDGDARPGKAAYGIALKEALTRLAGESAVAAAVRKYIPSGAVGMKTNCLARKLNSTPVALVDALSDLLVACGHRDNDIVVWERSNRELKAAGFELNADSFKRRCLGTDTSGVGYGHVLHSYGDVDSLVTRVLTDLVQSNINLPILKDHSIAGLSGGLKNMYGAIHNPNKYHDNNCDPFCAHVSMLAPIREKNRLTILDAVKVQYHGGPGYMAQYTRQYGGVVVSDDPVAADRIGLAILEHLRSENGKPPLAEAGRPVKYLESAGAAGLGTADLDAIDLTVVVVDPHGDVSTGSLY